KPVDCESIIEAARETGCIITVEEHNINGGLGSAVAEVLADTGNLNVRFKRIAFPDINISRVGSQEWLRGQYGMSPDAIAETIYNTLKG
ncbi:MAG: transketolase C-terminal domain-containing protein, partial [Clostridiales bacterium]|nr:transketolase C-terminal domain-containing protein [Clostridiales bacterium]